MAYTYRPIFIAVPKAWNVSIATANANRDGTGTVGTLVTAGSNGSRIDKITITAIVTTTAGMIRFFVHDGTNFRAFKEVLVTAITPSATVAAFTSEITRSDDLPIVVLQTGWSLRVATEKAETFHVVAEGGDF